MFKRSVVVVWRGKKSTISIFLGVCYERNTIWFTFVWSQNFFLCFKWIIWSALNRLGLSLFVQPTNYYLYKKMSIIMVMVYVPDTNLFWIAIFHHSKQNRSIDRDNCGLLLNFPFEIRMFFFSYLFRLFGEPKKRHQKEWNEEKKIFIFSSISDFVCFTDLRLIIYCLFWTKNSHPKTNPQNIANNLIIYRFFF